MLDDAIADNVNETAGAAGGGTEPALVARITGLRLDGRNVLHIGNRKVALQLLWQQRRDNIDIKSQASKASSLNTQFDRYALFAANKQIGLGSSADNLAPGMLAAATMVNAGPAVRNFLAAFQVGPSSWWLVAHRDGLIFEDVLVSDEGDARLAISNHLKAPDWMTIIAPVDWNVEGSVDRTLLEVIGRTGSSIKPVSFFRAYGGRIAIGLLLAAGAAGAFYAYTWFQDYQREQEAELARQQAELARVSIPKVVPYDKLPTLGTFVSLCGAEFEKMILLAPGWDQATLNCTAAPGTLNVATSWSRSGGRVQYLRALKDDSEPGTIVLDPSGDRAALSYGYEVEAGDLGRDAWEANQVESKLRERFQALGLELALRPQIQRLTSTQQRQLTEPVYNYHEITIDTSARLDEYIQLVSDVPVAAPQTLVYDLAQSRWTLTFRVYHPPILPPPPASE